MVRAESGEEKEVVTVAFVAKSEPGEPRPHRGRRFLFPSYHSAPMPTLTGLPLAFLFPNQS
jgi:hypothetical protein